MPIDVMVFGELAIRADLIEAIAKDDQGTRIVRTTGREYLVSDDFDLVIRVMKTMRGPNQTQPPTKDWGKRHTA